MSIKINSFLSVFPETILGKIEDTGKYQHDDRLAVEWGLDWVAICGVLYDGKRSFYTPALIKQYQTWLIGTANMFDRNSPPKNCLAVLTRPKINSQRVVIILQ